MDNSVIEQIRKKEKRKVYIIVGVFAFLLLIGIISSSDEKKESAKAPVSTLTQREKDSISRRTNLEKNFSSWDGSHRNLVKFVKDNMNDPNSFEHVETRFIDLGDSSIIVTMKYRGKNGFGGVVTESITAETTVTGAILKIAN